MLLMSAAGACGEAGSGNEPPPVAAVAGEADLESAAEAVSDDDSLAALQGVRWQWMAPDDGEAPPGDVSITAEFEPGRITGHAGCNGATLPR